MIKYAITDPRFHSDLLNLAKFSKLKEADFILYRDKLNPNYAQNAEIFIQQKAKFKAKFIIQNDINLAINLKFDGIHFSSDKLDLLSQTPPNLIKFASVHNEFEIKKAELNGANYLIFSPIFDTPNKKAIGIEALKNSLNLSNLPVIALGGIISDEQIKAVENCGVKGFASIRYFV